MNISYRQSMAVAFAVKAAMDIIVTEDDAANCSIEAYSNGREQGLHIVGPAGRASFSENRNSDTIVIMAARPAFPIGLPLFSMQGNVASQAVYDRRRFFDPDQIVNAAAFILSIVTNTDYGYAEDGEGYTFGAHDDQPPA